MRHEQFAYKRAVAPTAAQQRYLDWVVQQPCVVTGRYDVTTAVVRSIPHGR